MTSFFPLPVYERAEPLHESLTKIYQTDYAKPLEADVGGNKKDK